MSLRWRLTAAATVVIVVGLAVGGALLVGRLRAGLLAQLDARVAEQARLVAAQLAAGGRAAALPAGPEGGGVVQVVAAGGRVVLSSGNVDGEPALFSGRGGRSRPVIRSVATVPLGDAGVTYRVAALDATTPAGAVTVYAGLPTTEVSRGAETLVGALLVGLPVSAVVLAGVGWVLVGRALRPVEAMRRQVAALPGDTLPRRLPVPPGDDELVRLAETFNGLLDRIERANGRQQQFVADAAHELRSPLAALQTQLEVADRHPAAVDTGRLVGDLLAETVRLSRLADDLLQLARTDAGQPAPAHPVRLDRRVEAAVARRVGDRVPVVVEAVDPVELTGDGAAWDRVIGNLLDNACRHASHRVTVELREQPGRAVLVVADDGPGVAPGDRERVFERFTRLDSGRARDAGGAGLGLALVRDAVQAHGGRVWIEDNAPGARVVVVLPLPERLGDL